MAEKMYTIVVTAYNVEKYICRCLESIQHQLFGKNFEVILVNDGSTDGTLDVMLEYSKNYNFTLIDQKNMGTAIARMEGVKHANGTYLLFVDGDDYIDKKSLSIVDSYITDDNIDIYQFGYIKDYGIYKKNVTVPNKLFENIIGDKSVIEALFGGSNENLIGHVTSKVYRIELLKNVVNQINQHVVYGEDVYINLNVLFTNQVKTIFSVNRCWYYYRQGIGAMSKLDLLLLGEYQKLRDLQLEMIEEYNLGEDFVSMLFSESLNILIYHSAMSTNTLSIVEFEQALCSLLDYNYIKYTLDYYRKKDYCETHISNLINEDYEDFYQYCKSYRRNLGIILKLKITFNSLIRKISR